MSVAPEEHPVCCSCADLPLSDMPSPNVQCPRCTVLVGRAAIASVPRTVGRRMGADLETCCWCGVATDQAYYAEKGPPSCAAIPVPYRARPGFLRRLWRTAVRSVSA